MSMSDFDTDTDFDDESSSILNDIQELTSRAENTHDILQNSIQSLHCISSSLNSPNSIQILYEDKQYEFGELLHILHNKSLTDIKLSGNVTFGNILLQSINNMLEK